MSNQLNLYQKLAKIGKPIEVVQKNKRGYGYTYADEELLLSQITGLMKKFGVSLIPGVVPTSSTVQPYHYVKTKTTKDGTPFEEHVNEVMVYGDMTWTWVNNDNPDERIVVPWFFVGSQSDASQAFGSALTYSDRYFLLKYFNVATSDNDPDEYRTRQREAEETEDRLIAEKIIEQVHELVTKHLAEKPDDKQKVATITKKYATDNGRATANYYAITSPAAATELLNALRAEFSANKE